MGQKGPEKPSKKNPKKNGDTKQRKALQFARILRRIDNGDSPDNIAKDPDMPTAVTIRRWLKDGKPGNGPADRPDVVVTQELFDKIIELYGNGETISAICRKDGFPTRAMFYMYLRDNDTWLDKFQESQELHIQANMDRATKLAEDVLDDSIKPANFSAWFSVHKFIAGRSGASRFNGKRQDGDGPIDLHDVSYVGKNRKDRS